MSAKNGKPKEERFLMQTHSKIIEHGYFNFLEMNGSIPIREIIFAYSINKKENKFTVNLIEDENVGANYKIKRYYDSETWNKKQRGSWREDYYKLINANFLNIANEEKFRLLDSLASNLK